MAWTFWQCGQRPNAHGGALTGGGGGQRSASAGVGRGAKERKEAALSARFQGKVYLGAATDGWKVRPPPGGVACARACARAGGNARTCAK